MLSLKLLYRGKSEISATLSSKNQKASSDVGDGKSTTLSKLSLFYFF